MVGCLIIHGYTGGPYEVAPLVSYLKQRTNWNVYVPTLPGHGKKLTLDEDVSHEKWLETAEMLLNKMKTQFETIYIIGFSMGGMIAAYLAAKYEISKLVLLAPARKYISFWRMTRKIGEVIADGLQGTLDRNMFYVNYKQKSGDVSLKANIEFAKLIRYTKPYLKEIESPVLIAHGQQDIVVPVKTVHYLDKEIKSEQKQIVLFEQSDHMLCLGEDKDVLNNIIYSFLMRKD